MTAADALRRLAAHDSADDPDGDVIAELEAELRRTEADLAVAVHEATRARAESATNRETGGAWRDRALTAETQLHSRFRTAHSLDAGDCAACGTEQEGQS